MRFAGFIPIIFNVVNYYGYRDFDMSGSIIKIRGTVWNIIVFSLFGPLWAGILILINSLLIYYQLDGKIEVLLFGLKVGFVCIAFAITLVIVSALLKKYSAKIRMLLKI